MDLTFLFHANVLIENGEKSTNNLCVWKKNEGKGKAAIGHMQMQ